MVDAFNTAFSNILLRVSLPVVASCLMFIGLRGAVLLLQNASRRIRRTCGVVTLMFLWLWGFAMWTGGSPPMRDEKERTRAIQAEIAAERAAIGRLLLAGDSPRQLRDDGQMQSISSWEHGVYEEGACIVFPDGWVFPFGSNHLASVEVMAWGEVLPDSRSHEQIAAFGSRLSLVPGVSSFRYGMTSSNSCAFVWSSARDGRIDGEPFNGRIELFRNGDVLVATNGVAALLPRELPFSHDGFGQDAEWVAANFTNATEILAVGYPQWVDAQVGDGLTNGLYKFTATIPDDPPETVQLVVGDLSVAITNAGEYVFLLEKGIDYEYGIIPFMTNASYSAVDDVSQTRGAVRGGLRTLPGDATRTWTVDGGYGNEPQTEYALGRVWWLPFFFGSPGVSHIGPENDTLTFTANFADCRQPPVASYLWSASNGLTVQSPNAQTTHITIDSMPSWAQADISVTATFGGHELNSYLEGFTYGTNSTPQVHLSLNVPDAVLLNSNVVSAAKVAAAGWSFWSDAPTSGVVRVFCVSGADNVLVPGLVGEWAVSDSYSVAATLEGIGTSAALGDVVFRMEFCGGDATNTTEKATTVVRVGDVLLPAAPADGLVVLTNTPVAMLLDSEPTGSGSFLSATWHTRRLKSDGSYDEWQLAEYNHHGASIVLTPLLGGIYQIRALASVAAGGTDERFYVWEADENRMIGPGKKGEPKSIGVVSHAWQQSLRNCARGFLGSTAYLSTEALPAQYGFPAYPAGDVVFKCNIFVAHRIVQSGLSCPKTRGWFNSYPPLANDWADASYEIGDWVTLSSEGYPEPGYVAADPDPDTSGHMGILDFDGFGISAGMSNVNRHFDTGSSNVVIRKLEE
ncbi:MAG: hypothetical protein K6G94_02795 [Kiritimatiellae bacterium]|nr:hypothetical protein [Kiritimatiellia bacterium]